MIDNLPEASTGLAAFAGRGPSFKATGALRGPAALLALENWMMIDGFWRRARNHNNKWIVIDGAPSISILPASLILIRRSVARALLRSPLTGRR